MRLTRMMLIGMSMLMGMTSLSCRESIGTGRVDENVGSDAEALNSLRVYGDPSATQAVNQPSGTSLSVNKLVATNFSVSNLSSANSTIYVDGIVYPRTAAGINAAIGAVPAGGIVHLPAASYSLSCGGCASGTSVIAINKPLTLEGDGWGTVLAPDATVGATVNIIHLANPGIGVVLRDFAIAPSTGTPGKYGVYVDDSDDSFVYSLLIDHVKILQLGGAAIACERAGNGSFGVSTIQHSWLYGGIKLGAGTSTLDGGGDTIRIVENWIQGSGIGVDAKVAGGASSLIIEQNRITNSGGAIHIGGNPAISTRITENSFENENVSDPGSNGALVDIDGEVGSGGESIATLVAGNSFQVVGAGAGLVHLDNLRVNNASGTTVRNNYFVHTASHYDIVVTANAKDTIIEDNVDAGRGALPAVVSDSGANTFSTGLNAARGGREVVGNIDGRGALKLATEIACLASGSGSRFVVWSPGIGSGSTCDAACSSAIGVAQSCPSSTSCVEGWTAFFSDSTNFRYGSECCTPDPSNGAGTVSGKFCCCHQDFSAEPMYK